jgi:glycosyltransferase involved in cell wall biosynthesis
LPAVRVYLLTYRRNVLLRRALRSLLAQTFTDWVCEFHNDDPDDPFPARLAAETGDSRLLMRQHAKNLGATRTFNLVFAPAEERYVCLLEDDNWWEPTFLERLVGLADEHPEAGFVWSNMKIWQETSEGEWIATGKTTAEIMWPGQELTDLTWFYWPQPQQRFNTLHYNGSTLFRSSEAEPLQIHQSAPQLAMETMRDRALRYPGLYLREPLVNFAWTISTYREQQTRLWLEFDALLDASFLQCCPRAAPSAAELWRDAADARPRRTASLLIHAWLAGRMSEFARHARPRDWIRVSAHALRHPILFWHVIMARQTHGEIWQFLLDVSAKRFAEAESQGTRGWGPRRPLGVEPASSSPPVA